MKKSPFLVVLLAAAAIGLGNGPCATVNQPTVVTNLDGSTNKILTASATLKTDVAAAKRQYDTFMSNPFVQAGAGPAGFALTVAGLGAYVADGGDSAEDFANQICAWCKAMYALWSGKGVTPDQVDAVGRATFEADLNAEDPKFAMAFGQVQDGVKRMMAGKADTATKLAFLAGVEKGASLFCSR